VIDMVIFVALITQAGVNFWAISELGNDPRYTAATAFILLARYVLFQFYTS
jgi:hypothetical protein